MLLLSRSIGAARRDRHAPSSRSRWSLCVTRGRRGFTLVELLTAVAVVGIVAAIATPAVERVSRSLRIEGSAQALVGDLNRARTEAIKRNNGVELTLAGEYTYRITGLGLRRLDAEVRFTDGSPDTVRFNGFGTALQGREVYTIQLGELERRVVLDAAGQARIE